MKPARWNEFKEAFAAATEIPETERVGFLADLPDDIRAEVANLLAAHDKAENFIAEPAMVQAGFADHEDPEFYAGKQIDAYKIVRRIGHGGMGTVYLANRADESFDKPVAVKLINRGMDTNAVLKRFVMERKILASLEHPNIAGLLDGGSTKDGLPYLVMEYVDGEPIGEYCQSRRMSIEKRLELFQKVCSAISYAHQNLVVHRDIKPSNILITENGTPKLLDFGIAKLLHPDWSLDTREATATMFRVMTPEYASPEQMRGLPVSTASDVYSLGVVLYELLSGERPYRIGSRLPEEALRIVMTAEPIKPSSVVRPAIRPAESETDASTGAEPSTADGVGGNTTDRLELKSLRGDLDNIILKALRKEPDRRYPSVQELSEDIRRHLEGLPVTATADTSIYRARKFFQRHKAGVVAAASVALILIVATAVTTWQAVVARREQANSEQRFNDVRQLANSLVFEFHDSIRDLPGSTPVREMLVTRALEYLDKLATQTEDASLKQELATAYDKIGDIQGGFGTSHLGQREKANVSYRKALAIRETLAAAAPSDITLLRNLSTSYTKLGDILWIAVDIDGALESYEKALEINKSLVTEVPDDPQIRTELAIAFRNVGYMDAAKGDTPGALLNARKAVELFEAMAISDPDNMKLQFELALSYDKLAEILTSLSNEHAEALALMRKAQRIGDTLLNADPQNTKMRRGQAVGDLNVANVSAKIGDTKTGLASAKRALSTFTDMMRADPENEEYRQAVSIVQVVMAEMMIKEGNAREALTLLSHPRASLEKSFADAPTDEIAHFRLGDVYATLGRGYAALARADKNMSSSLLNWQVARSSFEKSQKIFATFNDAGKLAGEDAEKFNNVNAAIDSCDAAIGRLGTHK